MKEERKMQDRYLEEIDRLEKLVNSKVLEIEVVTTECDSRKREQR